MTKPAKQPTSAEPQQPSPEASLRAVAILEVLGGVRTAAQAAAALGISLNHYYLLEKRALGGLTAACESRARGPRGPGLEKQVETLQKELEQCRRECLRQAALVRAAQRAVGLKAVPPPTKRGANSGKAAGKRRPRKRRPQVRALRAAEIARENSSSSETPDALSNSATDEKRAASPGDEVKEHSHGS